ncbi:hypothetical protein J5Y09_18245 [Roseomonas sp. PWR1]|uniref:Uncharacterized protein n=1 Tax=Roseomonas nitratireducens TaxID=2820810 RepID=A0ABS4AWY5_9PROT|nr:hypothetical protein [Neoroseomonas nitratireducens]MBP0465873.1 hypothetical protein [Neoroseomonas nitratireducens]
MPALPDTRLEAFAQHIAANPKATAKEAARSAGVSAASARVRGPEYLRMPEVIARIGEIRGVPPAEIVRPSHSLTRLLPDGPKAASEPSASVPLPPQVSFEPQEPPAGFGTWEQERLRAWATNQLGGIALETRRGSPQVAVRAIDGIGRIQGLNSTTHHVQRDYLSGVPLDVLMAWRGLLEKAAARTGPLLDLTAKEAGLIGLEVTQDMIDERGLIVASLEATEENDTAEGHPSEAAGDREPAIDPLS